MQALFPGSRLANRRYTQPPPKYGTNLVCSVDNAGIGIVLRSEDPQFKPGDLVNGYFSMCDELYVISSSHRAPDFQEYTVFPGPPEQQHAMKSIRKLDRHPDIPISVYLGTLGTAGRTGFAAFDAFAGEKVKTSKTLFVSTAAGPVGTSVLARPESMKVMILKLNLGLYASTRRCATQTSKL